MRTLRVAAPDGAALRGVRHPSPPFSRARVPFLYAYPLDALIKAAKFSNRLDYLNHLGRIMADRLRYAGLHPPECLVPVPMHWRRLVTRGYNQALELARPLARELGVPLCTGVCRRLRYTEPQTGLSARDRPEMYARHSG